jgi:hypothetical protein
LPFCAALPHAASSGFASSFAAFGVSTQPLGKSSAVKSIDVAKSVSSLDVSAAVGVFEAAGLFDALASLGVAVLVLDDEPPHAANAASSDDAASISASLRMIPP